MTLGRGIRRVATLYDNVTNVLDEVDAQNSEEPTCSTIDRRWFFNLYSCLLSFLSIYSRIRTAAAWPIILDIVPSLKQLLKDEQDVDVIVSYLNEVRLSNYIYW